MTSFLSVVGPRNVVNDIMKQNFRTSSRCHQPKGTEALPNKTIKRRGAVILWLFFTKVNVIENKFCNEYLKSLITIFNLAKV